MKLLGNVYSFFKLSDEEKDIYYHEISLENSRRACYLALIAIPICVIHVAIFASRLTAVTGVERQWVASIMYTHLTLLILAVLFSILLYFFVFRWKKSTHPAMVCTNVMLLFILVLGTVLAAFDQYVTPSVTPFIFTTILVGLFFQLRPIIPVIYFTASYLVFYVAVSQLQVNHDVVISNQVNGLSISAIGLSSSMILWYSKLTRIKQRQQITRQNKALSESNAEKDKFFSIIAHDLKSPFNSILGFSDLLIHQVKDKDYDGIDEYARIIKQSSESAMDLLLNLMDWSKAHTGRMEFKPETIDLNEMVDELDHLFAAALLQKQLRMTIDLPDDLVVFADRNMIHTVLRNLISNAIKFTHPNGHIVLAAKKNLQECLISVSDDGVGISKENINKLFRIDENYSTLGTNYEKGTGLGLILCKELMEKHGGRIGCESELGKGSQFYISLPFGQHEIHA